MKYPYQKEVTDSCGCVFCDLELEPDEMIDGQPVHAIDNDIVGNGGYVPCTKPVQ